MTLPLPVKVGEVWYCQHGRASPRRTAEQGTLQPVFVPIFPKRPCHSGRFGPLQILVYSSETNRATAGDLPQPQAQSKLQSKNFLDLAHGQSPGWQAILPLCREATRHRVVQRRWLREIRAQAERGSGIGLKLFGFIAESVFTFIPESCSRSTRNSVRNHPGIAFTFLRIPQELL
jgi:hypothetical protein